MQYIFVLQALVIVVTVISSSTGRPKGFHLRKTYLSRHGRRHQLFHYGRRSHFKNMDQWVTWIPAKTEEKEIDAILPFVEDDPSASKIHTATSRPGYYGDDIEVNVNIGPLQDRENPAKGDDVSSKEELGTTDETKKEGEIKHDKQKKKQPKKKGPGQGESENSARLKDDEGNSIEDVSELGNTDETKNNVGNNKHDKHKQKKHKKKGSGQGESLDHREVFNVSENEHLQTKNESPTVFEGIKEPEDDENKHIKYSENKKGDEVNSRDDVSELGNTGETENNEGKSKHDKQKKDKPKKKDSGQGESHEHREVTKLSENEELKTGNKNGDDVNSKYGVSELGTTGDTKNNKGEENKHDKHKQKKPNKKGPGPGESFDHHEITNLSEQFESTNADIYQHSKLDDDENKHMKYGENKKGDAANSKEGVSELGTIGETKNNKGINKYGKHKKKQPKEKGSGLEESLYHREVTDLSENEKLLNQNESPKVFEDIHQEEKPETKYNENEKDDDGREEASVNTGGIVSDSGSDNQQENQEYIEGEPIDSPETISENSDEEKNEKKDIVEKSESEEQLPSVAENSKIDTNDHKEQQILSSNDTTSNVVSNLENVHEGPENDVDKLSLVKTKNEKELADTSSAIMDDVQDQRTDSNEIKIIPDFVSEVSKNSKKNLEKTESLENEEGDLNTSSDDLELPQISDPNNESIGETGILEHKHHSSSGNKGEITEDNKDISEQKKIIEENGSFENTAPENQNTSTEDESVLDLVAESDKLEEIPDSNKQAGTENTEIGATVDDQDQEEPKIELASEGSDSSSHQKSQKEIKEKKVEPEREKDDLNEFGPGGTSYFETGEHNEEFHVPDPENEISPGKSKHKHGSSSEHKGKTNLITESDKHVNNEHNKSKEKKMKNVEENVVDNNNEAHIDDSDSTRHKQQKTSKSKKAIHLIPSYLPDMTSLNKNCLDGNNRERIDCTLNRYDEISDRMDLDSYEEIEPSEEKEENSLSKTLAGMKLHKKKRKTDAKGSLLDLHEFTSRGEGVQKIKGLPINCPSTESTEQLEASTKKPGKFTAILQALKDAVFNFKNKYTNDGESEKSPSSLEQTTPIYGCDSNINLESLVDSLSVEELLTEQTSYRPTEDYSHESDGHDDSYDITLQNPQEFTTENTFSIDKEKLSINSTELHNEPHGGGGSEDQLLQSTTQEYPERFLAPTLEVPEESNSEINPSNNFDENHTTEYSTAYGSKTNEDGLLDQIESTTSSYHEQETLEEPNGNKNETIKDNSVNDDHAVKVSSSNTVVKEGAYFAQVKNLSETTPERNFKNGVLSTNNSVVETQIDNTGGSSDNDKPLKLDKKRPKCRRPRRKKCIKEDEDNETTESANGSDTTTKRGKKSDRRPKCKKAKKPNKGVSNETLTFSSEDISGKSKIQRTPNHRRPNKKRPKRRPTKKPNNDDIEVNVNIATGSATKTPKVKITSQNSDISAGSAPNQQVMNLEHAELESEGYILASSSVEMSGEADYSTKLSTATGMNETSKKPSKSNEENVEFNYLNMLAGGIPEHDRFKIGEKAPTMDGISKPVKPWNPFYSGITSPQDTNNKNEPGKEEDKCISYRNILKIFKSSYFIVPPGYENCRRELRGISLESMRFSNFRPAVDGDASALKHSWYPPSGWLRPNSENMDRRHEKIWQKSWKVSRIF